MGEGDMVRASAVSLEQHGNSDFTVEEIDYVLWTAAVVGGSPTKTARQLELEERERATSGEPSRFSRGTPPSRSSIELWVKVRYKDRYHQIQAERVGDMDELLAQSASNLVSRISDAEERALKQTLAGLGNANGIEASQILRNLAQTKDVNIRGANSLRGKDALSGVERTLGEIASELGRIAPNVISVETLDADQVEEAEVVKDS
jgi:hypothetical protein